MLLVSFTANFHDLSRMKKDSQNQRSIFSLKSCVQYLENC